MFDHRAIVVGHRGQDGKLLCELLLRRGVGILGVGRGGSEPVGWAGPVPPCQSDNPESVFNAVRIFQPHDIYYIAAHHNSSQGKIPDDLYADYRQYLHVNVEGPIAFMEAIYRHAPKCRFVYASTSVIFGNSPRDTPQTENTPASPEEPYGMSKLIGGQACRDFRKKGVFASVAILYNHESVYRLPHFLSMKIVHGALAASRGDKKLLVLGDLDASVDWGYAPDFVEALTRILGHHTPEDFIVATNEPHTVREFAALAYGYLGLDWNQYVTVDPNLLQRRRSGRVGSYSKLRAATGWKPTLTFEQMVHTLIDLTASRMSESQKLAPSASQITAPFPRTLAS